MAKSLQLKCAIWACLSLTWSAMAYAAEVSFADGLESIPPKAMACVLVLAIVGGVAGTLAKLARPDVVVRNLSLEIVKDILASVVAGMLAFFFAGWLRSFDFWATAIAITLAGYGGSKVLDVALGEGLMPWLRNFMQRVLNTAPPTEGPK